MLQTRVTEAAKSQMKQPFTTSEMKRNVLSAVEVFEMYFYD